MHIVIPFCPRQPKTRLSQVMSIEERQQFACAMLQDVIDTVQSTGTDPEVLSTESLGIDCSVTVDDGQLSNVINHLIETTNDDIAVVMADLPLLTSSSLSQLLKMKGDIVIAPGRGGGTNGIVIRHNEFRVDYHGNSYQDHLTYAEAIDIDVSEIDSFAFATDIDEPEDLGEVLLHSQGKATEWLRDAGFSLETTASRVTLHRD